MSSVDYRQLAVAGDRLYCPIAAAAKMRFIKTPCHYFGGGIQPPVEDMETPRMKRAPDIFPDYGYANHKQESLITYFNTCRSRI